MDTCCIQRMIFFLLITIFQSCTFNQNESNEVVVRRLVEEVSKKLAVRHHLLLGNINIDTVREGIREIRVMSILNKGSLPKDELRKIIVDCVDEFLQGVNNKDKIKSLSKEYPFTSKNLSICILMYNLNGSSLHHPEISAVSNSHGIVYYNTMDANGLQYESEEKETFEEVKAIVRRTRRYFQAF